MKPVTPAIGGRPLGSIAYACIAPSRVIITMSILSYANGVLILSFLCQ